MAKMPRGKRGKMSGKIPSQKILVQNDFAIIGSAANPTVTVFNIQFSSIATDFPNFLLFSQMYDMFRMVRTVCHYQPTGYGENRIGQNAAGVQNSASGTSMIVCVDPEDASGIAYSTLVQRPLKSMGNHWGSSYHNTNIPWVHGQSYTNNHKPILGGGTTNSTAPGMWITTAAPSAMLGAIKVSATTQANSGANAITWGKILVCHEVEFDSLIE